MASFKKKKKRKKIIFPKVEVCGGVLKEDLLSQLNCLNLT